jgi:hypothetical protein
MLIEMTSHRFNKEKILAGKYWVRDTGSRHGLALCAAELCSMGSTGFYRTQYQKCFKNLRDSCEENISERSDMKIRQHMKGLFRPFRAGWLVQYHDHLLH